jgi:uncharacterized protein
MAKISKKPKTHKTQSHPWLFLGLTLGLTWILEFFAAGLQEVLPEVWVAILRYAGGVMPLLIAILLLFTHQDAADRREFWRRLANVKRIRPIWWIVILLFIPLQSGLAALMDLALGGWGMAPEAIRDFLGQPLMIIPTLLFWLIFGPLPEEPGWRGYALEGLQERYSSFFASLSVGVVWALWHLPLFFIEGSWQAESIGLGTQRFYIYLFSILFQSFIYTWIVNHTDRSILAAILFHFSTNAFGELFELSPRAEVFNFLLLVLFVIVLVVGWVRNNPTVLREHL